MIKIILEQDEDQFDLDGDFIYNPKTDMEMTFSEEASWSDVMKGLFKTLKVAGYLFDKNSVLEHITEDFDEYDF